MTKKIYVTSAQVDAAQLIVERSVKRGMPVSSAVRKIAEAVRETDVASETDPASRSTNA
jgi:hypothetical protein